MIVIIIGWIKFYNLKQTEKSFYPVIGFNYDIESNSSGYELYIDLEQHQSGITYETFVDFRTYQNEVSFPIRIFMRNRTQSFNLQLPFNPDSIVFNPDLTLLGKDVRLTNVEDSIDIRRNFIIGQNYPNPFNSVTIIPYNVPGISTLQVFDINGRITNTFSLYGSGYLIWDGTNSEGNPVSTGVYFYWLNTPYSNEIHKMILIK
ncbi:MAG: T9SS type A sorting domain-containing protein [candidate division Zixibacteria bacterium]|nr:T9SS type A sorting domain-containing protein [candidate division Zixibacteria bacterium]